ncbi:MAG TPA: alanine racemase [Thermoleophilia bacterium]|nr:alanine racemase [Thermoleophilia bacterium]
MYPQLTFDLDAVSTATGLLAARLLAQGIELVGVTKALDGEPLIGQAMLEAGAAGLADSRLPALVRLAAQALAPLTLLRSPQPHELVETAQVADRVTLTDPEAARTLGEHAPGLPIELLLAVDLGDRREGVLPDEAGAAARRLAGLPGTSLAGISVNFACLSGQLPTTELFRTAEDVLDEVAAAAAVDDPLLSLGGTCCVQCLEGFEPRFRTELRSGGGPLYGYDFVSGAPVPGLDRFDPVLSAVVLEAFFKPPAPAGAGGRDAFGHVPETTLPDEPAWHALVAVGRRDCEFGGLRPLLDGAYLAGMTSDVCVLITPRELRPGEVVDFALDYDALVRAVTSPFVTRRFVTRRGRPVEDS